MTTRRGLLLFLVKLTLIFGLAIAPWPGLRVAFSTGFAPIANLFLEGARFGHGGRARIEPRATEAPRAPGENLSWDATLILTAEHRAGRLSVGISLRREAYLPLVIVLATLFSAPLPRRRRLWAIATGVAMTMLGSVAALLLFIQWLFATQAPQIHPMGSWELALLDLAVGALLQPPGTRFVAPFVLGLLLVALFRRTTSRRPQQR